MTDLLQSRSVPPQDPRVTSGIRAARAGGLESNRETESGVRSGSVLLAAPNSKWPEKKMMCK